MTLSTKRQRFVEEYLLDSNATQAAKRAGYSDRSAHVTGWRLLQDDEVKEALAAGRLAIGQRLFLAIEDIVEMAEEDYRAVRPQLVEQTIITDAGHELTTKVLVGNPMAAKAYAEMLLKRLGAFVERSEVSVTVSRDRVEQAIADLEAQLAENDPVSSEPAA